MFKNREGKVRSGWKIAAVLAIFYGSIMVVSIIIGMLVSFTLMATGDLQTGANAFSYSYTERGQKIMENINMIMMFIQEILTILIPILAWKISTKRKLSDMGFTPIKSNYKELIAGLLFGIVSITVVFAAIVLSGQAEIATWRPQFATSQLLYLFMFIMVGFAEEILSRGYIMSVLRQTKSIAAIMIVPSVIFALLHSSNSGIGVIPYINLTLVGILFSYMYLKSGNIWMPIGYHITWNYFQGNVFGFKVSGTEVEGMLSTTYSKDTFLNGGAFGPEGGLFVTGILLIGFFVVHLYYKNKKFDFLSMDPRPVIEPVSEQLVTTEEVLESKSGDATL
ncbi:MAG: family intrarane metalloprotease protein [Herbinix sp.]|jgi:membrane protease YdiL (CAAX protease family)|nr:family intrarane metalloprotease protein [Herbinix sp.]